MRLTDSRRRYLAALGAVSALLALFFYASFFLNLRTTLSEWSGSVVIVPYQLFYNFLHGRPFQLSVFGPASSALGYSRNPYHYMHAFAHHTCITPYAFAFLWALHPTLSWLYAIYFIWSLAGSLVFTRLILQRLDPEDTRAKTALALSVFLASGLLCILNQFAQFLMFSGTFILAAYYCLLTRRRAGFILLAAALCLLTEDAAMMVALFGLYIYLFEPGRKRYAWACWGLAIPYLLLVLLVIQPGARSELTHTRMNTAASHMIGLFALTPKTLFLNLKALLPTFTLLPAFAMAGLLFGFPIKARLPRIAALAFVPAGLHWAESAVIGAAHHQLPPYFFLYLALLVFLGEARGRAAAGINRGLWAATACFLLVSGRVLAQNLPLSLRPALYRLSGNRGRQEAWERLLALGPASNRDVIRTAASISPKKSLVYMANDTVDGFLTDRSSIWTFPSYFDEADYLLVQKDATDLLSIFDASTPGGLKAAASGSWTRAPAQGTLSMTPEAVALFKTLSARGGTHRVAFEDEHVLLLENLDPRTFESPPSTMGILGWARHPRFSGNK